MRTFKVSYIHIHINAMFLHFALARNVLFYHDYIYFDTPYLPKHEDWRGSKFKYIYSRT